MTAARDFIAAVHAQLCLLDGAGLEPVVGRREWAKHGAPGCIKWALGDVAWDAPDTVGGQPQHIITRLQQFHVVIWCDDEDACSIALDNLVRALRAVSNGRPNFDLGRFEWFTDDKPSWLHRGEALAGTLSTRLQVTRLPVPNPKVRITIQTHQEELDP